MQESKVNISDFIDGELYDFLEDKGFRNYVLYPDTDILGWKEIEKELELSNIHFSHARRILLELQSYFRLKGLPSREIDLVIDDRLQEYKRYGVRGTLHEKQQRNIRIIAACIAILVIISVLFQWTSRKQDSYSTGSGEQLLVELSEGSTILLNGNSSLTWNRNWKKLGKRTAVLKGEGYFTIQKQEGYPFEVETENMRVEVLGTVFNVKNRRSKTDVYLEEGSIKVNIKDKEDPPLLLTPGDRLVFNNVTYEINRHVEENVEEVLGWKDGLLIYKEESLSEVISAVSDIYGKNFQFSDSTLLNRRITTTIPLANWEMTSTAIQLAMKLNFEEEENTVKIIGKD